MFVVISKYLVPKGFRGITLFPFIFLREKSHASDKIILNHERIHLKQQLEMLILLFYIWYGLEFMYHLVRSKNSRVAYLKISFEREAYAFEKDTLYLKKRKFWAFLNFL
ncbi:hypothetical protein [Flavobacterium silvaticum]|uniref:hypothetical protein n=1 Tax=Flavobacterium silvaticum TaxID=1852020 RepID=UPI001F3C50A8|nr:hypothetical protein [Flavobacterium silvaticum]